MRPAALVALVLALSGCASEPSVPSSPMDRTVLVTAPSDYTNDTGDNVWHLHDYWGGKDSLPLVDETHHGIIGMAAKDVVATFQPPGQSVVPLGTAHVIVTVDLAPRTDDFYTSPELWIRKANENQTRLVAAITPGTAITVPSTNEANDLPHQELSAWLFEVWMSPPDDVRPLHYNGDVHLKAEVHRGLPILPFPPHLDQWAGRFSIDLLRSTHDLGVWTYDNEFYTGEAMPRTHVFLQGAVVPLNYSHLEVKLEVDARTPNTLGLVSHGANTRVFTHVEPTSDAAGVRTYRITGARGDGAYARQSLWDFGVQEEGLHNLAFSGTYTITATVHRGT